MDCGPQDMICAVGREMRDYGTLVAALRGSSVRCHIAAGGQGTLKKRDRWVEALTGPHPLPPNVSVGPLNFLDLRTMYAQSRFVVMPLLPTRTDNGTTSILEAMAMGKAVICSRVDGQSDVIRDGETGVYVPPGDPEALRSAIEHLWSHPDIAERMGRAARLYVEQHHTLDEWVRQVRLAVEESVEENAKRKKQRKRLE
jgi:glycosyltransferase involved in cell wall biosynthesis